MYLFTENTLIYVFINHSTKPSCECNCYFYGFCLVNLCDVNILYCIMSNILPSTNFVVNNNLGTIKVMH